MRHYFLTSMGIEQWHLRAKVRALFYGYRLIGRKGAGVLLADIDGADSAQTQLLQAIAAATQCQLESLTLTELIELKSTVKVAVLLGANVAHQWCGTSSAPRAKWNEKDCLIIVSHAPAALLTTNSLKAEVWQDLQSAMQILL